MRSTATARTDSTKARGGKPRRLASATAALTLGGLLVGGVAPAHAAGLDSDPCFATCGQYRWFLKKAPEIREAGACCMPLIRKAKVKEERALKLYEEARDPTNTSAEASDLMREANRQIGARGRLIRKFIECVNGVQSAFNLQRRGDDPTEEYAAACGVTLECGEGIGE